jgi:CBS domain-containing protein
MPDTVISSVRREAPLVREDDTVGDAVAQLAASGLPAVVVVDGKGRFAGIFGEREFIGAIFPGYLGEMKAAAFVPASLEASLEKRSGCRRDPVSEYMTTEHVEIEEDASDAQVAEIFLHHRVLIIPVVADRRPVGLITRNDFFRAVAERFTRMDPA